MRLRGSNIHGSVKTDLAPNTLGHTSCWWGPVFLGHVWQSPQLCSRFPCGHVFLQSLYPEDRGQGGKPQPSSLHAWVEAVMEGGGGGMSVAEREEDSERLIHSTVGTDGIQSK